MLVHDRALAFYIALTPSSSTDSHSKFSPSLLPQYAPSWYFAMVAKGDKACPIDPNQIDPLDPDPINPGFATPNGPTAIGRRLKSLA